MWVELNVIVDDEGINYLWEGLKLVVLVGLLI